MTLDWTDFLELLAKMPLVGLVSKDDRVNPDAQEKMASRDSRENRERQVSLGDQDYEVYGESPGIHMRDRKDPGETMGYQGSVGDQGPKVTQDAQDCMV